MKIKPLVYYALAALGLAMAAPAQSVAQTVTRDAATGDFVLTFTDMDDAQHRMLLPAIDLMSPFLNVTATETGNGDLRYHYVLGNGSQGSSRPGRGPSMVWIPCPSEATWRGVNNWSESRLHPSGGYLCRFLSGGDAVSPGDTVAIAEATTSLLPMPVNARVIGQANAPAWPVETDRVPQRVLDMADSLTSVEYGVGGGTLVTIVVPGISPSEVSSPQATVDMLRGYAAFACDTMMWISPKGICRSLTAKLDELKLSLTDGRTEAARGAVRSALNELDALEGSKHVGGSADALLRPFLLRVQVLLR